MKQYIIDGNNLIGKMRKLSEIQKKDKQASREKLAFLLENYFFGKKVKVSLHLDGHPNLPINTSKIKIIYSESKTADEKIKLQIENAKNRSTITVVSSDGNIREFARVCGCDIMLSEDFGAELSKRKEADEEKKRIEAMNSVEEFKKLFNVK